ADVSTAHADHRWHGGRTGFSISVGNGYNRFSYSEGYPGGFYGHPYGASYGYGHHYAVPVYATPVYRTYPSYSVPIYRGYGGYGGFRRQCH
ncbi:MAG: hypothetical protein ACK58L_22670, partial [Planctomycetota bacterium]